MDENRSEAASIRAFAKRLRAVLTLAFWIVALLLLAERLGYAGVYRGAGADPGRIGIQIALSLPALLYLAALWMLRSAIAQAARGDLFGRAVVSGLKAAGVLLISGSLAALFITPLVSRLVGEPVERLINADVATLIIAAIGLGQIFIGALMGRAAEAERELADFF